MRYPLRRGNIIWWPIVAAAILTLFSLQNGFEPRPLLGSVILVGGLGFLMELAWRRQSYVKLHDFHLEISRYRWGAKNNYLTPNLTVPYAKIRDVQLLGNNEVAVYVDAVESPYEMTEPTAMITFRPKHHYKVLEEIRLRVAAADDFANNSVPLSN